MRVLADGRVRRTEAEWRVLVERQARSGLSELAFCKEAKLSRGSFRKWKQRIGPVETPAGFVEWAAPEVVEAEASRAEFELTLPGGAVLRWRA